MSHSHWRWCTVAVMSIVTTSSCASEMECDAKYGRACVPSDCDAPSLKVGDAASKSTVIGLDFAAGRLHVEKAPACGSLASNEVRPHVGDLHRVGAIALEGQAEGLVQAVYCSVVAIQSSNSLLCGSARNEAMVRRSTGATVAQPFTPHG